MASYHDRVRSSNGQGDEELFWLAFCYLAGELSARQVLEFESRMETDQAAREAVSQAVDLAELTAAAESMSRLPADFGRRPTSLTRSAGRLSTIVELPEVLGRKASTGGPALVVAAGLALVIACYSLFGRNAPGTPVAEPDGVYRRLAGAWAASNWSDDTLVEPDAGAEGGIPLDFDELALAMLLESEVQLSDEANSQADSVPTALTPDEGGEGELLISDWLLEAVYADQDVPTAESNQHEG